MTWVDRYTQNLKIQTGDNKEYELFTKPSFTKDVEYHYTEFSFVNIDGKLVKKRKQAGRTFPLEFFFIGEDCIENAKIFEISLKDENPCLINHPYYDSILAQIVQIKFDDTELNVSKVTCTAIETITDDGLSITSNPIDVIILKKEEIEGLISANPEITPTITDVDTLKLTTGNDYKSGVKILTLPSQAQDYFNAFNTANSAINTITSLPIQAMQALTNFLTMPAQFSANVQDRIRILLMHFDNLRQTIVGLTTVTSKKLYEAQGSALISAICLAAVTPLSGNYANALMALKVLDQLKSVKTQFFTDLDSIQNINGGNPNNYFPSFTLMNALNEMLDMTIANLYTFALAGRTEYSYVLTEDSNVILLTHRFYDLDPTDNNIDEFIANNNLKWNEIGLIIEKGKTILYYR